MELLLPPRAPLGLGLGLGDIEQVNVPVLSQRIKFKLDLFHGMQRITKRLRKRHGGISSILF